MSHQQRRIQTACCNVFWRENKLVSSGWHMAIGCQMSDLLRMLVGLLLGLCLCACGFAAAIPGTMAPKAAAQTGAAEEIGLPASIKPSEVAAFIAPLSDTATRRLLIQSLEERAQAATQESSAEQSDRFSNMLDRIRSGSTVAITNIRSMREQLPRSGEIIEHAFLLLTDLEEWPKMWLGVGNLGLMILAGFLVVLGIQRFLGGMVTVPPANLPPQRLSAKLLTLGIRAGLRVAQLVAFIVVGNLVSLAFFDRFDPMRLFLITCFGTIAAGYAGNALARQLFAPSARTVRLPQITDSTARHLTRFTIAVCALAALSILGSGMLTLLGVPHALVLVFQLGCGLAVLICALICILYTVSNIEPESVTETPTNTVLAARSVGARARTLLLVGAILWFLVWGTQTIGDNVLAARALVISAGLFFAAWYLVRVDAGLRFARLAIAAEDSSAQAGPIATGLRMLLLTFGALAFLQGVGLDFVSLLGTQTGQLVGEALVKVALALILAAVTWVILSHTIERFIRHEQERAQAEAGDQALDEEGGTGIVSSRLGTLLPILRGFALVILVSVTAMIVLSSIGVDIGPLLAGAGVVGIAIGFGAQTLVRDIFSGFFFLLDDAFRVGEYIEAGPYRGEVERISIRSMRVRHHRGPVQTIPFGELRVVVNHNRDWVIYKQEFEVPYEADIEKIRKIIKGIGRELSDDPEHGVKFLQPLKSQGVRRVENGVLVIGTKFMCKPREQFVLRRIIYQRVRDALYKNGIHLAHRRVQVEMPSHNENGAGQVPDAKSVAGALTYAAAGAVIATSQVEVKPPPDEP